MMIGALHKVRDIATELQEVSSVDDTRQPEFARIIEICDRNISHFTDDGK